MLAGVLAYGNSLSGPFLFDDDLTIVHNASLRAWWNLSRVFSPARESPVAGRPLVNLSFALNYAFGGLHVRGYHVVNLMLHLTCAVLLFALVRRSLILPRLRHAFAGRANDLALAVALLWVVHPLNSEVVDYVTQRTESMMAVCYLLTLLASLRAVGSHRWWWVAGAIAFCAMGMACKESMVTAPLMVMLYDRIFVFGSWRDAWRSRWPLYGGLVASWGVLVRLMSSGPRMYSTGFSTGVSAWTYALNQCDMLTRYLRLAIWPRSLVLVYGEPRSLTLFAVSPSALLIVFLLGLTVLALVKRPMLGFLGAWFFVTLAPTSSVVPIATEVGAERRMYVPLMALVAFVVIGAHWTWTRLQAAPMAVPRRSFGGQAVVLGRVVVLLLAASLAAGTISRNREYASGLTMASLVLQRWPSGAAHFQMGSELAAVGRHAEAATEYELGADRFPRARYYWAGALLAQGRREEAIREFQRFIREKPDLSEVISAHLKIGAARQQQGNPAAAIDQYHLVLTMTPSNLEAQLLLGEALASQRAFEEAVAHYRVYLAARPDDLTALTDLGMAFSLSEHHDEEAVVVFRRVVAANPQDAAQRSNLARALFLHDELDEAIVQAQAAVTLNPQDVASHDLLGRALAMQGKFDDAISQYERALQIEPGDPQAREDLARIRERMARPVRPPA